jgi:sugar phosphate isomerase/epimerase
MALHYPLAFSSLACPDWTLEEVVAAGAEYGYSALELRILDGAVISSELLVQQRARIRQVLHQRGLGLIGLGASTRFASPDSAERTAQGSELLRLLQLASELEAPVVRTYGGTPPVSTSDDDAVAYVVAGLEPLLSPAEQLGVTIGLETHDTFSRGALVARVLAALPHPRLGVIWDVLHPLRFGEPVEATWQFIGPRVVHVHIKDGRPQGEPRTENREPRTENLGTWEPGTRATSHENPERRTQNPERHPVAAQHPAPGAPTSPEPRSLQSAIGQSAMSRDWNLTLLGEGVVPVPQILELLRDGGYAGYLSVEWEKHWHRQLAAPEVALPQHIAQLRRWMEAM